MTKTQTDQNLNEYRYLCLVHNINLAIWVAVGPLVGVRYGQELAKRWQREQWIRENRNEECRELLQTQFMSNLSSSIRTMNRNFLKPIFPGFSEVGFSSPRI
jgi:hypothetical protein